MQIGQKWRSPSNGDMSFTKGDEEDIIVVIDSDEDIITYTCVVYLSHNELYICFLSILYI